MVLVPARARKGQSGSLFAQEDMTAQVFSTHGLGCGHQNGNEKENEKENENREEHAAEKSAPPKRSAVGMALLTATR
jgi:hypothetical protein